MRPKFLVFVMLFVLAILVFIFWLHPARYVPNPKAISMLKTSLKTNQEVSKANVKIQDSNVVITRSVPINSQASTAPIKIANPVNNDDRISKIIRKFNNEHNAPIEFYAEVIDLNSNPVPSVKVNISIYQTIISPSQNPAYPKDVGVSNNIIRLQEETGFDGRLKITGENGYGLDIDSIQKDGYELSQDTHRSYKSISGSFEYPIIIKLRKN